MAKYLKFGNDIVQEEHIVRVSTGMAGQAKDRVAITLSTGESILLEGDEAATALDYFTRMCRNLLPPDSSSSGKVD